MPELSQRIRAIVTGGTDGWGVHYRARQMLNAGTPVVMLSVGDHDISTDRSILAEMQRSAEGGHLGYTAVQGTLGLRTAIAGRYTARGAATVGPENVIVTSGGQGAIFASMMAALDPGDACVVLDPFYASFDVTIRSVSADPVIVPTAADDGFQPDATRIEAALTPRTRAILMNSPNNPTGAVYAADRVAAIADLCRRRDLWLISDELYDSQVHDGAHTSPRDLPGMAERTFLIGSMSKGHAMTGARIGWSIAPKDAVDRMLDLAGATTYGLPGFLQDAAEFALTQRASHEAEVAARYRRRRDLALAIAQRSPALGVVPPGGGMYVMLDIRRTGLSGTQFAERLLDDQHIAVMPGESFGRAAAGHIRIALTVADESLAEAVGKIAAFAEKILPATDVAAGA
ncbi:MAG: pyridoxal phosphate-dependent aminotransferase [Pseudomonadota bacterium]